MTQGDEMEEIWKAIPGYDGIYEVSSLGHVRSLNRKIIFDNPDNPNKKVIRQEKGRIRKSKPNKYGYPHLNMSKNDNRKFFTVHTLVMLAFIGERPKDFDVAHLNGKKDDNRLSNLRYVTKKENCSHKNDHGTAYRGSRHHKAYLSEELIKKIRSEYQFGVLGHGQRALGKKYNIPEQTIRSIVLRHVWKHI